MLIDFDFLVDEAQIKSSAVIFNKNKCPVFNNFYSCQFCKNTKLIDTVLATLVKISV